MDIFLINSLHFLIQAPVLEAKILHGLQRIYMYLLISHSELGPSRLTTPTVPRKKERWKKILLGLVHMWQKDSIQN